MFIISKCNLNNLWINKRNQDLNLFFILLFIDIFIDISKKSKI